MHAHPTSLVPALLALALPAQVAITDTAGAAKRIWAAPMLEHQEVWFRRTLEFAKPGTKPRLWFSCDNECTVFVNGREVGTCIDHQQLTMVGLEQPLRGKVTVAVHAKNTGGPAALSLWLLWEEADGQHEMCTDEQWRVSTAAAEKWSEPQFDDSRWDAAVPNFDTTFGLNLYNGTPTAVRIVNAMTPDVEPIARALDELRAAGDAETALKALDKIERAVMAARARLWRKNAPAPATDKR
ncbi:MAG: hypothetical protein WAT39_01510 [Planctomycetota bacterium]